MSLRPDDPRSRGRSKSPSGRIRERSRSRDSRLPPAPPEPTSRSARQYLVADPSGDKVRTRSRSRGASPLRERRSSSRYDHSGSDSEQDAREAYRQTQRNRDRYYESDSGESKGAKREGHRYVRAPQRPPARYGYSDESDSFSDSDDDALAYGEAPGSLERGYYGYTGPSKPSTAPKLPPLMTGAVHAPPTSNNGEVSGSHPSYARPEPYRYAVPAQPLPGQPIPAQSGPPSSPATWAPVPDCEQPGFVPVSQGDGQSMPGSFPTPTSSQPGFPLPQYMTSPDGRGNPYAQWSGRPASSGAAYTYPTVAPGHQRNASADTKSPTHYVNPPAFQYANIDPNIKYTSKTAAAGKGSGSARSSATQLSDTGLRYSSNAQFTTAPPAPSIPTSRHDPGPQYVEISPGNLAATRPSSNSISSGGNLAVAGPDPNHRPASPMLEPYRGTYQSMSPMPSPIIMSSKYNDDVSDMEPLDSSSDSERRSKRKSRKSREEKNSLKEPKSDRSKRDSSRVRHERHGTKVGPEAVVLISPATKGRRVTFYDAAQDAVDLKEALSHARNIDTKTLTHVLPHLTSDEILDLRKEYKNHVKIHGKGINLAKHIRVKLGNTSFGKVCYATALGRWESEAFWANCYYQSGTSRRELLIESLFGRSNSEMRAIKESFKDSRYLDSLEKCMKAELKADKFRTAVLLALEENRQSDRDPIDVELVQRDVQALHAALVSRHGGETAMIYIIVRRSDPHLREVLRAYEKIHGRNFAREMIQKSQNLVGETLAHILNGAINRPMRDALLLHQALRESRSGRERSELLISRLVRLHWEPRHLEAVKNEYRRRYGERLEEAIAEEILTSSGGSDWGEFCIELAQSSKTLAKKDGL